MMEMVATRPAYHRVEDYFGLWSMYGPAFNSLFALITDMDLRDHVEGRILAVEAGQGVSASAQSDTLYTIEDGIAVIRASGTLMKAQSSFSSASSTVALRQALRAAGRDPKVKAVLMVIDSPGGTVAGTHDLAAEFAALEQLKPTAAYAEDLCASAAYWVASQAGFVACNPTALVGSIGTFMTVQDSSGRAEDLKIKVHVIKAGEHKGAGTPGTAVTDSQLETWQKMVDDMNAQFLAGVAKGRHLTDAQVKSLADGRVHVGDQAKSLGLVDAVQSMEATIRQLQERAGQRSAKEKGTKMTQETTLTAPAAATADELKAAFPKADDSFLMKQMLAKATMPQAKDAWLAEVESRLVAKDKELADVKATSVKPAGVEPLGSAKPKTDPATESTAGGATGQWETAVAEQMKLNGGDKRKAISKVVSMNPGLQEAYLAEVNRK